MTRVEAIKFGTAWLGIQEKLEGCEMYEFFKMSVKALQDEEAKPTKGKWMRMSELSEQEDDRYQCSYCGNVVHHENKMDLYTFNSWCGRCGSDNGRK